MTELLTPKELWTRLQISPRTLYYLQKRLNLPRLKSGRIVRYDWAEVEPLLRDRAGNSGAAA
jgi:predicted DNA-binding transcriptional regulator AlpA